MFLLTKSDLSKNVKILVVGISTWKPQVEFATSKICSPNMNHFQNNFLDSLGTHSYFFVSKFKKLPY
jgi:hypothetical protein